ncbi:2-dehydro-3-deoxy-D-arabinonate dehydratase [Catenuloplanes nepalensis]|uniref:2-dehydro-3-deoxy-D-arabinonate dehydratase n=1 Tax=Catenuloplanes nepalensis TaxID=587533 RepID=A0ABT9MPA5_9ACTN|nr:fumarylacetoacetate hydrolase family protein [Catenuloplanes nepalensis]MDP9793228.1 2-dehydro-3-deoxy-D-arabinonate dehydratase [Catenuloplanes nepalensis]
MLIIRYETAGAVHVGVAEDDGTVRRLGVPSLGLLLALPTDEIRSVVERSGPAEDGAVKRLPPVDGQTEVWASGVTYVRSRAARREESQAPDVYSLVYDAERPELFFKSAAWRVCGDGEPIGIRPDSAVDVPEPELALVLNATGRIVGYTVCDDVSSRSIEGENPLYLPQAKVYAGSCALGPGIRPAWEVPDATALGIGVVVRRGSGVAFEGTTSTSLLHRTLDDLAAYLFRSMHFPEGAILSTGTGLVPALDFTLHEGDVVEITVDGVGTLTNPVVAATPAAFAWLAAR